MSQNQIARQRLCLTADKTELVDASDERAAFLFATPGDEILPDVAEQFGLIDGALPGFNADADVADEAAQIAAELEAAEAAGKEAADKADAEAAPEAEVKPAAAGETKPAAQGKRKA